MDARTTAICRQKVRAHLRMADYREAETGRSERSAVRYRGRT
jgi:hypothetical protein